MNRVGIIQGRLTHPREGFQDCPSEWQKEFNLLPGLGLSHIEWIVTKEKYDSNPIHSENLKHFNISSVCADFLVHDNFLKDETYWNKLEEICLLAFKNEIPYVTLPLLEGSSVVDSNKRSRLIYKLKDLVNKFPFLKFSIEAELGSQELLEIVNPLENVYITYDTGNMTSFGSDHYEYLNDVLHKVNNVHLKDRDHEAVSYIPGQGKTPFKSIFKHLKESRYNGPYTIQTAREEPGQEIETITNHLNYFMETYNAS